MHRIFKKYRRYFPIPFGIRESFCEIAARRKRVNANYVKESRVGILGVGVGVRHLVIKEVLSRTVYHPTPQPCYRGIIPLRIISNNNIFIHFIAKFRGK